MVEKRVLASPRVHRPGGASTTPQPGGRPGSGTAAVTVGRTTFVEDGGMIGFTKDGSRLRFDIDKRRAEEAGFAISSRLLKLARSVRD